MQITPVPAVMLLSAAVVVAVAITCLWHVWSVGGASFFAAQPG